MSKEKLKQNENPVGADASVRPNSRGITLIALIITIIVMLILVGVSVTVALNGGLFSTAKEVATKTQLERDREKLFSAVMASVGTDAKVDLDKLYENLPHGFTVNDGKYISENGNTFKVDENGNITIVNESEETIVTGTTLTNTPNAIQVGDLVYVGDSSTDKAKVYANRGDINYNDIMTLTMNKPQVTEEEIKIASKVEINEEVYTVNSIAGSAFYSMMGGGATSVKKVTIPNTVTSIEASAFQRCTSLEKITIPSSVTSIGGSAFLDCTLLEEIQIPNSVTDIGGNAFTATQWIKKQQDKGTNGLVVVNNILIDGTVAQGNITAEMLEGIIEINRQSFNNNTSITSIEIPTNITKIGDAAFQSCEALEEIQIPNSVTSIGGNAFYLTPWLATQQENSINGLVIINGNMLINASSATGDVVIPNTVEIITGQPFGMNSSVTSVTIPNSVRSITGGEIFLICSALTEVKVFWSEGNQPTGWADNWNGSSASITYNYNPES